MPAFLSESSFASGKVNSTSRLQTLYLYIAPSQYHFLKFILEGYDNLAVLSCVDNKQGIVVLRYPKELREELLGVLTSLTTRISISEIREELK